MQPITRESSIALCQDRLVPVIPAQHDPLWVSTEELTKDLDQRLDELESQFAEFVTSKSSKLSLGR